MLRPFTFIELTRKSSGIPIIVNVDAITYFEPTDFERHDHGTHVRVIDNGFDVRENYDVLRDLILAAANDPTLGRTEPSAATREALDPTD